MQWWSLLRRWPVLLISSLLAKVPVMVRAFMLWVISAGPIPSHIAFIMDGNRRFADRLHLDRYIGHSHGYDTLLRTLKDCFDLRIKVVTLYAFSIENFQRSPQEVSALMELMKTKLETLVEKEGLAREYGIRVRILGDLSLLPPGVRMAAEKAMAVTSQNSSAVLNLCIAYTSTHEIVQSIQRTRDNFLSEIWKGHGSIDSCSLDRFCSKEKDVPQVRCAGGSAPGSLHEACAFRDDFIDTNGICHEWLDDLTMGDHVVLNGSSPAWHDSDASIYKNGNCTRLDNHEQADDGDMGRDGNGSAAERYERMQSNHRNCISCDSESSQLGTNGDTTGKTDVQKTSATGLRSRRKGIVKKSESVRVNERNPEVCQAACSCKDIGNEVNSRQLNHTLNSNGCMVMGLSCKSVDRVEWVGRHKDRPGLACCLHARNGYEVCGDSPGQPDGSNTSRNLSFMEDWQPQSGNSCFHKVSSEVKDVNGVPGCTHGSSDKILKLVREHISEDEIEKHLYTYLCSPPDILIRTSGETRLSNFLLWQASFSHLAFCKVLWPEFSFWDLLWIIVEYQRAFPALLRKQQFCNMTS